MWSVAVEGREDAMPGSEPVRAKPVNATVGLGRARGRGRDRRVAFGDWLEFLNGALHPDRDPRELRLRFEEGMRRLLSARRVAFRSAPAASRLHQNGDGTKRLALDVPNSADGRTSLEVVFDATPGLDAWDVQVLNVSRYLASLVLELERCRTLAPPPPMRRDGTIPLVGSSAPITALRERITRVAATDFTVMIEGESGTGKELVARHIHAQSRRARGPFVAVNCAAIVESLLEAELFGIEDRTATGVRGRRGKFELAHEGTLFLDEVSDLTASAQAKLLRAIQDLAVERVGGHGTRRVDTRIVVATNRGLLEMVESGKFRADLYYRLSGVEIRVPPLRDRRDDVPELAQHLLERHRAVRRLKVTEPAIDALLAYDWPGNVRELERVMERAIALAQADEIRLEDLPGTIARGYEEALMPALVHDESLRTWGSRYARLVLQRHNNNKRQTCRALGISYHTLRTYLRSPHHKKRPPRPGVLRAAARTAADPPDTRSA
jgi:two-component system, NtrC family, response regulator AtoC